MQEEIDHSLIDKKMKKDEQKRLELLEFNKNFYDQTEKNIIENYQ